jgi:hypothetical protein
MKRWNVLPVITFSACVTIALHAAETAPQLRVSANHRYLEDTSGRPFFLVGDCPQNLPLKLAIPELDDYLADCERKGFNLLWICIDGQRTASPTSKPPQDQRGALMMTNGWQIGSLNPEYFVTIDAIVDKAKARSIYCMFTPLSECQWSQTNINRNGPDEWYNYGKFLGARYKRRGNILWQLGNDTINTTAQHKIVQGIKDAGDTHLMTVNWRPDHHREGSGWMRKYEHGEHWIDLNAWYMNAPVAQGGAPCYWQKIEYERPNPMPLFPTETQYQQPYAKATDLECRMQNYYAALGGGCGGQVYGSGWLADNWDYAGYRENGGRRHTMHFMNLFRRREWWSLVPDYGHSFVTAGYGTLSPTTMDYVGAAINPAGTLGMAYCPKEATITVDLSGFSGPVSARWYDPTDGASRDIPGSPFSPTDKQPFRTPAANRAGDPDWVLILEASR